jgi:hypothetical protein
MIIWRDLIDGKGNAVAQTASREHGSKRGLRVGSVYRIQSCNTRLPFHSHSRNRKPSESLVLALALSAISINHISLLYSR